MITSEDIALIIAEDLKGFGMAIYTKGHIPVKGIEKNGRIVIIPKTNDDGTIFDKCFVEVNFNLPDVNEEADYRLDKIERDAYKLLRKGKAGKFEDQWYNISFSSRSREEDTQLKCHYVHIQLLFETLNTL